MLNGILELFLVISPQAHAPAHYTTERKRTRGRERREGWRERDSDIYGFEVPYCALEMGTYVFTQSFTRLF